MRIDVVTIFGDYLAPLHLSLVGRAIADGLDRPAPSTTCVTSRTTGIAPWTTPRTAAGPAW